MLREIKRVSRKGDGPKKRWFTNASMDLFIWIDRNDSIVSYQLAYDKPHAEKALIWNEEEGLAHMGVDDGSRSGKHPGSPLLVHSDAANPARIISMIRSNLGDSEASIVTFIVSKIEEYYQENG